MKPGPVFFTIILFWLILAAVAYFLPSLVIIWIYAGLALVPFALADLLLLMFLCDRLSVKREMPSILSQGGAAKVRLIIRREEHPAARKKKAGVKKTTGSQRRTGFFLIPFDIRVFDLHPVSMDCKAFPAKINRNFLKKGAGVVFDYSIIPNERGPWKFDGTELMLSSPFRLWKLKVYRKCESRGKTYPDFNRIKAGADLRGLLEKTGVKNIRRRGQGMEFMNLRDYQEGDSIRDIDWRAASRRFGMDGYLKLAVREYQEEQDQQVLFLLDTGYRLHKKESAELKIRDLKFRDLKIRDAKTPGPRTQFDSALEAILLLSWVSLKHGDSVAAASFGETTRWLFPGKGMSAFPRLMNGLYDLKSSPAPSSPFYCLEEAMEKLKRRTFIILISNFREEDGESLSWILKRIKRRHLLLLVSLRENDAETIASRHPSNADEALESAAALSYLVSRRELYQGWEHQGLLTLETSSQTLSPALINRYLQVKRSGRL